MEYKKIEQAFESGIEGVGKFLETEEIKDIMITIEDYQSKFKGNSLTDEPQLKEALNILTGVHSEVTIIAAIAEAYAETNEARALLIAKNTPVDDGKGGQKAPTDEVAKAMSKDKNLPYLRTANLFTAYSKVCGQKIMTIQSMMNYLKKPIPPQG
jgi:hypothetical protein